MKQHGRACVRKFGEVSVKSLIASCPGNHSNTLQDAWPKRVRCGPPSLGNPEDAGTLQNKLFRLLPPSKSQAKTSASVQSHEKLSTSKFSTLQKLHPPRTVQTLFIHTHENQARGAATLSTELGQRSVPAAEAAWSRGRPSLDSARVALGSAGVHPACAQKL